ncbi:MAG: hypothetical protein ACLP19_17100 [Xanthobacteraceae bacterium]
MARKKPSLTEQWMKDHPNDTCPFDKHAARAWRASRGIGGTPFQKEMRRKYEIAITETRERRAAEQQQTNSASPHQ